MQKPSKLQYKMPGGDVPPLSLKVIKIPKNCLFYGSTQGKAPKNFDFSLSLQVSKFDKIVFLLYYMLHIVHILENCVRINPANFLICTCFSESEQNIYFRSIYI